LLDGLVEQKRKSVSLINCFGFHLWEGVGPHVICMKASIPWLTSLYSYIQESYYESHFILHIYFLFSILCFITSTKVSF